MAERPGFMVYYDRICPALARLNDAEAGMVFRALVNYSLTGELPELEGSPGLVFDLLRPGLDRDAERYESTVIHSHYMVYCRECKAKNQIPVSEEVFREQLSVTGSNYQLPTPSPAITPSPSPSVSPSSTGKGAGAGKGEGEGLKGGERGNQQTRDKLWDEFEKRRAEAAKRPYGK